MIDFLVHTASNYTQLHDRSCENLASVHAQVAVAASGHVTRVSPWSMTTFACIEARLVYLVRHRCVSWARKVDIRLPGKGNSNSHGARPVY